MREGLAIRDKQMVRKYEPLWICEYNAVTIIHRTDIWKKNIVWFRSKKNIMGQTSGTSIYEEQIKPKHSMDLRAKKNII
jgi:hypothetical protein